MRTRERERECNEKKMTRRGRKGDDTEGAEIASFLERQKLY